MIYGMSEKALKQAKYKVRANKAYLKSHGIEIDSQIIPFARFTCNSYINQDRYIAELQHRAWSIHDYAKERDLVNVFITLTLPSVYHPTKSKKNGHYVFNKNYGGRRYLGIVKCPLTGKKIKILNPYENRKKYFPREASKQLSKMFKKILDSRLIKSIPSKDRCYFRVTEPHKSGTPHLHISFFVPAENAIELESLVTRLFPAPAAKVEMGVKKPVSYLMKYVLFTCSPFGI